MRFAWIHAAGATLIFVIAGGCSSEPTRATSDGARLGAAREAIQNGTTDSTDTFAVGVYGQNGGSSAICSGSLITPNLVVTARHCVNQTSQQIDCNTNPTFGASMWGPGELTVTTSTSMGGSAVWHTVKQIITPTDTHVCGNDIALLILQDLVPSSEATPIVPGVQYPMDAMQYTLKFDAIGYGATSPANGGTGTRRIKSSIPVYCIPGSALYDCPTMDAMGNPINISPREFPGGDGTCEGDSGSGAIDHASHVIGPPVSHGVLSRGGVSMDGTTCVGSLYTRLDAWRDLVVTTANMASNNWTLYPKPNPDWTIYVPPPATADGGADSGSKPTTKPSGKGLGEQCAQDSDCASKMCRDEGDGTTVCTVDCSADPTSCPSGYECRQSMCLAPIAPANANNATSTTTSGGCSVSASSRDPKPAPWRGAAIAAAAIAGALARRRRLRA